MPTRPLETPSTGLPTTPDRRHAQKEEGTQLNVHVKYMTKLELLESFRSPFTVNGNGEKRHKVSRDTPNWATFTVNF